jgi:hypothetical protein
MNNVVHHQVAQCEVRIEHGISELLLFTELLPDKLSCGVRTKHGTEFRTSLSSYCIICDIPNLRMLRLYTVVVGREALLVQQKYIKINLNCFSIATGYGLNGLCSIPGGGKRFFSSPQCEDRPCGPPSFVLSRFMGVTNRWVLYWMIWFTDHSFAITRNHNKLQ